MSAAIWSSLFEYAQRQPGASEEQIQQFLESLSRRFSQWEAVLPVESISTFGPASHHLRAA